MGSRAGQNLYSFQDSSYGSIYQLSLEIPKQIFNPDYPVKVKTLGDRIRKARMDAGLQIKDLAGILGVTNDTVINWELRNVVPCQRYQERVQGFLGKSCDDERLPL